MMNYLKENYGTLKVNQMAKVFNQSQEISNKSLQERITWAEKITELIKSQFLAVSSAVYESEDAREKAISKTQDHIEALFLMAANPTHQETCLSFLGRNDQITIKDVVSLISHNKGTNKTALIADAKSNNKGKKPKKHCQVCNENHYLNECPEFRKAFPYASIIKKFLKPNGTKESPMSNEKNYAAGWVASNNSNIKCDDWIFDSGSTLHICNDRSKFVNFEAKEGSQISGVAGNVVIE